MKNFKKSAEKITNQYFGKTLVSNICITFHSETNNTFRGLKGYNGISVGLYNGHYIIDILASYFKTKTIRNKNTGWSDQIMIVPNKDAKKLINFFKKNNFAFTNALNFALSERITYEKKLTQEEEKQLIVDLCEYLANK